MAWPANYQGCTVEAEYRNFDGTTPNGTVEFSPSPSRALDYSLELILLPKTFTANVVNGVLVDPLTNTPGLTIPATNDPDISPLEFTYKVTENFFGGTSYNIEAPVGATINLCDVSPVPQANGQPIIRGPRGLDGAIQTVQGVSPDEAQDVDLSGVVLLRANALAEIAADGHAADARAFLGVGDSGTHDGSYYLRPSQGLQRAQNLADLTDKAAARTQLGLAHVTRRDPGDDLLVLWV